MIKVLLLTLLLSTTAATAQQLQVPQLAKDGFAKDIVAVLNDAFENFDKLRGGKLGKPIGDVQNYKVKRMLDGATNGRIVDMKDSVYCEYLFDKLNSEAAAQKVFEKISDALNKSMKGWTRFEDAPVRENYGEILKRRFGLNSFKGMYQYNMELLVVNPKGTTNYRVYFKVLGGDLPFYMHIGKQQPTKSVLFKKATLELMDFVSSNNVSGLSTGEAAKNGGTTATNKLPGYDCSVMQEDSLGHLHFKAVKHFNNYASGAMEFEIAMTNLQMSLGSDYIYAYTMPQSNVIQHVHFRKLKEMDNKDACKIVVQLLQHKDNDFELAIRFVPQQNQEAATATAISN
jgi:hypothetical protein